MDWTDDVVARLRAKWEEQTPEGHALFSTAELGRQFGVSKNAIVGKAHRLELPGRPSPIRYPSVQAGVPHRARPVPLAGIPLAASLPPLLSARPLLALACEPVPQSVMGRPTPATPVWRIEPKQIKPSPTPIPALLRSPPPPQPKSYGRVTECQWPIGDPGKKGFRMCHDKSEPGKVYCPDHCKKAYGKSWAREDA